MIKPETIDIIVFLRDYPDIDHMTPVIYRLTQSVDVKVKIFAVNPFYNYSSDKLINYLKKEAEYHNLISLFEQRRKVLYWIFKYCEYISKVFNKVIILNFGLSKFMPIGFYNGQSLSAR